MIKPELGLLHVVAKTWTTITLMRLARSVTPMKTLHDIGKHFRRNEHSWGKK